MSSSFSTQNYRLVKTKNQLQNQSQLNWSNVSQFCPMVLVKGARPQRPQFKLERRGNYRAPIVLSRYAARLSVSRHITNTSQVQWNLSKTTAHDMGPSKRGLCYQVVSLYRVN